MNNKKIISALLSAVMIFVSCSSAAFAEENITSDDTQKDVMKFYVAPGGEGNGTLTEPFGSIYEAKEYIARKKKTMKEPKEIQVIFREGVYRLNKSVVFNEEDSGFDNEHRIVYKAFDDEKVEFRGSVEIDITKINKVTDQKILRRLPEESKDNVGVIDLKEQGFSSITTNPWSVGYVNFYLNGKQQPMSQWPNGDNHFAEFTAVSKGDRDNGKNGGTLRYENTTRPSRWLSATDLFLNGYPGYDYRIENVPIASVSPDNSTITLKAGTNFGIINTAARRWKAFNLLEEIDRPGEWYLDRTNMLLYYYPECSLSNATFEMSYMSTDMITVKRASNLSFEGIVFSQTNGHVINGQHSKNNMISNITIDKCTFTDIGGRSIYFYTYDQGDVWDLAAYQCRLGNLYNLTVTNNIFYNNRSNPVEVVSGNKNTGEEHGLNISNNYANQPDPRYNEYLLGMVISVGGNVTNNLGHNGGNKFLDHSTEKLKITHNEMVNTCRETTDVGSIYCGRSVTYRGTEIAYNFGLNANPAQPNLNKFAHNRFVYLDDSHAGLNIHHNIFAYDEPGDKAISTTGAGSKIQNNITYNAKNALVLGYWKGNDRYKQFLSEDNRTNPYVANYIERYPNILKEYEIIKSGNFNSTALNEVTGNFIVKGKAPTDGQSELMILNNTFENNTITDDMSMFVDPENHDFRVKKDSDIFKQNPELLSEDFDLSTIGIQWEDGFDKERIEERKAFRKLYPKNGATEVNGKNLEFSWQKAFGADKYRFIIATDVDFKNVIDEQVVPYNHCVVEQLKSGYTDYYWKVTAINETLSLADEWDAYGVTYRFTTSKHDFLDFTSLEARVDYINSIYDYILDGTEAGTFKEGTKAKVDALLKEANEALSWKIGSKKQEDIDDIERRINEAISEENMNVGYYDLGTMLKDKNLWMIRNESTSNITFNEDGHVIMSALDAEGNVIGETFIECQDFSLFSRKILFAFSMKVNWGGASPWVGFGIRGQEPYVDLWSCENYFFAIKPDVIEVQLRGSGKSGILETFENNCIKEDQWHDVVFGAYDCGFGQMMVLFVDSKPIKIFMDSDADQITRTGGLKLYMSKPGTVEFKPISKMPEQNFDEMVWGNMITETGELCKKIEAFFEDDAVILYDSVDKYYVNGSIQDADTKVMVVKNETEMIRADKIPELFGYNTEINEGKAIVDIDGKKLEFIANQKEYSVDGINYSGSEPFYENGYMYVSLASVANVAKINMNTYQGFCVITKIGNNSLENTILTVGAAIKAFKKINEEGK